MLVNCINAPITYDTEKLHTSLESKQMYVVFGCKVAVDHAI